VISQYLPSVTSPKAEKASLIAPSSVPHARPVLEIATQCYGPVPKIFYRWQDTDKKKSNQNISNNSYKP